MSDKQNTGISEMGFPFILLEDLFEDFDLRMRKISNLFCGLKKI